jgi:hypothetical protein
MRTNHKCEWEDSTREAHSTNKYQHFKQRKITGTYTIGIDLRLTNLESNFKNDICKWAEKYQITLR